MIHGLSQPTVKKNHDVFTRFPQVEIAILYGSHAKGNYKSGSDIDLTLVSPGLSLSLLTRIEIELDDLLLPYEFDLSLMSALTHPALLDHIRRMGIVFYEKNSALRLVISQPQFI
jgi:uncharacterized protein